MNALTTTSITTMSSRQIAEIVESRHTDVCRTIDRLMEKGVILGYTPTAYTHHQNGQIYNEYHITKRDSYVVVAQLSPEFTARLVDRWQELEEKSVIAIPQTYAEALQLAADQAKQLELAAPKVEFVDKFVDKKTLLTASQVGQNLGGISAVKLNKMLEELDVYNHNIKRNRVFKQWFVDAGYGQLKQTEGGFTQALFTTSGQYWLAAQVS